MIGVLADWRALADQLGRLVAVERRHAHVHQDHREVLAASRRSAARPESASTIVWPSGASIARSARRLAALSSTTRTAASGLTASSSPAGVGRDVHQDRRSCGRVRGQPLAEHGQQAGRVDRLGDVGGGAGVDAALALAGLDLGGDGDDRQVLRAGQLAHRSHRRVAIHDRHHDVDQHDVDVRRLARGASMPVFAALGRDDLDLDRARAATVRAKMLRKSSSTTSDLHARQAVAGRVPRRASGAASARPARRGGDLGRRGHRGGDRRRRVRGRGAVGR